MVVLDDARVRSADAGAATPAPTTVRVMAWMASGWCLVFAAVNAWQLVTGTVPTGAYPDHREALVVMSCLVLLLKLVGAWVAVSSVDPIADPGRAWRRGVALWGGATLLALYSVGNVVITVATVTGMVAPSAAWEAAGGVTVRAVAYLLFFVLGGCLFAGLAVSFHRRRRVAASAVVVGVLGAPVVLGGLLVVVPAMLRAVGVMPPA